MAENSPTFANTILIFIERTSTYTIIIYALSWGSFRVSARVSLVIWDIARNIFRRRSNFIGFLAEFSAAKEPRIILWLRLADRYLKYYWTVASRDCGSFRLIRRVKFVANDYTNPNRPTNRKTLTTLNPDHNRPSPRMWSILCAAIVTIGSIQQWRNPYAGGDGGNRPPLRSWNNFFSQWCFLQK